MTQSQISYDTLPATQSRILLVEDDEDARATLSEALGDLGFEVEARGDGAAGLERAGSQDFDVVLTDLRMPNMDGLELCRRLNGDRPQVPVVLMTAFGDLETALGALRAGAFDFIIKPFAIEQVADTLRRASQHGAQRAQPVRAVGGPGHGETSAGKRDGESGGPRESLEIVERRHILHVLDAVSGNKAEAARTLGIDRATLYRKLRRYGIEGSNPNPSSN